MIEVRCRCGKKLGDREGRRLVIRRVGLILRGGCHTWDCSGCNTRNVIDLDEVADVKRLDGVLLSAP